MGLVSNSLLQTGINYTVNGMFRIPALMVCATSMAMAGEVAFRGLAATASLVKSPPKEGSFLNKAIVEFRNSPFRPFGRVDRNGDYLIPTHKLVSYTVASAVAGVLASEAATYLCGTPPGIYNNVLTVLGPFRIDSTPWLTGVTRLAANFTR